MHLLYDWAALVSWFVYLPFASCLHVYLAVIYVLMVNIRTQGQTAQRIQQSGRVVSQSWHRVEMTMVSQETDWIWAQDTLGLFFPGRGVKSRLQCWGCMCPAPRAKTHNMGHTHTHSLLSLIISSIIKSGEKLIIFRSQCPCWCSFWHNTGTEQTEVHFGAIWIS